jgi:glycosyltransferase involved in cell wall biosynthesis
VTPALSAVVVTARRPQALGRTLEDLLRQDVEFQRIVVVDDDPEGSARSTVEAIGSSILEYVPSGRSRGPAGARAAGVERVLPSARPGDWVGFFDDDPIPAVDIVSEAVRFGSERLAADPRTAAVGAHGGVLDRRIGRLRSVTASSSPDVVEVDYLSGGWHSVYRLDALRDVGSFHAPLFFGWEELDLGLRLRRAGYHLYVSGPLYRRVGPLRGAAPDRGRPSIGLEEPDVRRYYDLRNMTYILRTSGNRAALASMALTVGVLKPALGMALAPRRGAEHLRLGLRAIADGLRGRLGPAPPDLTPADEGHTR